MMADFLANIAQVVSGANVQWIDCQPDIRQQIYFANHTSHLDFLVLWAALPKEVRILTRPVAAKDYWERGRARRYLATKVFNAILIERRNNLLNEKDDEIVVRAQKNIETIIQAMGNNYSLILFPEGSRGTGEEIGIFKSGLYYLSRQKPNVELIPVYIDNLNRILPKGELLPVPMLSSIIFGAPIRIMNAETKEAFLERARQAMRNLNKL